MLLCSFNDPLRDAQLFTDEERVGFARHANAQFIGGAQRFQIKLAACIDNAFRLQRKDLELCIVGGSHQEHTTAAQLFNDGHCQRSTLGRVRTGTQLIQQDQRVRHGQLQNAGDFFHVARECGKALLNTLLIANVHKELIKNTDLAPLISRDKEAALRHGTQKACCFQRDRLAARIGAGNDERIILLTQRNVHRDTFFRVNERVPRPDKGE